MKCWVLVTRCKTSGFTDTLYDVRAVYLNTIRAKRGLRAAQHKYEKDAYYGAPYLEESELR